MNKNRIELLKKFITDDPADPFNHYALALELVSDEPRKAIELFDLLITRFPDYLPTYYHAAKQHQSLGDDQRAVLILTRGIDLAKAQGNPKAKAELQSVLDELQD